MELEQLALLPREEIEKEALRLYPDPTGNDINADMLDEVRAKREEFYKNILRLKIEAYLNDLLMTSDVIEYLHNPSSDNKYGEDKYHGIVITQARARLWGGSMPFDEIVDDAVRRLELV